MRALKNNRPVHAIYDPRKQFSNELTVWTKLLVLIFNEYKTVYFVYFGPVYTKTIKEQTVSDHPATTGQREKCVFSDWLLEVAVCRWAKLVKEKRC